MRGEPAPFSAINRLYAATLARDNWGAVLEQVRDAFGGHHVILAMHDLGTGAVPFAASVGIAQENQARFLSTTRCVGPRRSMAPSRWTPPCRAMR